MAIRASTYKKRRLEKITKQLGMREYEPIFITDDESSVKNYSIDPRTVVFIDDISLSENEKSK